MKDKRELIRSGGSLIKPRTMPNVGLGFNDLGHSRCRKVDVTTCVQKRSVGVIANENGSTVEERSRHWLPSVPTDPPCSLCTPVWLPPQCWVSIANSEKYQFLIYKDVIETTHRNDKKRSKSSETDSSRSIKTYGSNSKKERLLRVD